MGSASCGEAGEPCCPDDCCAADVVTKLGPTGSLGGEAWSYISRLGRARRTASRPGAHLGFAGCPRSAACSRRRSSTASDLGIPGGAGRPRAELGRAHIGIAA
jgi:hypothetical protein